MSLKFRHIMLKLWVCIWKLVIILDLYKTINDWERKWNHFSGGHLLVMSCAICRKNLAMEAIQVIVDLVWCTLKHLNVLFVLFCLDIRCKKHGRRRLRTQSPLFALQGLKPNATMFFRTLEHMDVLSPRTGCSKGSKVFE